MSGSMRRLGVVAAVTLAVSGCAVSPRTSDGARLHDQAQAALSRWSDALARAGGSSGVVLVGDLTGQIGDWEEAAANNKSALMAGQIEAAVSLASERPPDGQVRGADGTVQPVRLLSAQEALAAIHASAMGSFCSECAPLRVTAARLTTRPVETSRGEAEAPVWEFTIEGTAVRVTRVAIANAVSIVSPVTNAPTPGIGIYLDSATGTEAGREVTVSFTGAPGPANEACGADYTAQAVESATAVVVIVFEQPHAGLFEACTGAGAERTATATLGGPLGSRTVLQVTDGQPVRFRAAP